ncbi:ABC transporter ATP-binding protein [Bradyrhizobium sp.]|uniref:ABC transporter ATP-binding protein n=1 Tax=Bradyrhizobium sp. TaxID=376 RepID=UPI0039E2EF00
MTAGFALEGIVAGYRGASILHDVSFALPDRGALVVIGPNGSGKSTLMKVAIGLVRPSSGRVLLAGEDVTAIDAPGRVRRGLGYVPQEANVFRNMSVHDNLRIGFEALVPRGRGLRRRIDEVLEIFPEIVPKLGVLAGHLSGGQRQMVAMGAALMPSPTILALDEPSAGLSPRNAELLFAAIRRIAANGVSLFLIEQNTRLGLGAARTGLVLVAGKVKVISPVEALVADDSIRRLYLGGR